VVLTWGTALERERSERIAAAVPRASVFDRRPLDVVAGQIAGADFVVGVDTGLLHVAAALGVPRVEVIGAVKLMPVLPLGKGPMMTVGSKGEPPSVEAVVAAFAAMWDQAKTGPDAGS
jgi:heptosyltransferase-1